MTDRSKAHEGRAVATLLILLMGLSALPITNVSAEDYGDLFHLQAQDIEATFDNDTELTTITWRNIDSLEQPSALDNFFTAIYNVYRHTEAIDSSNIDNATLVHQVTACDNAVYQIKYSCLGGDNGSHTGHNFSFLVSPGTNSTFYYGITTTISSVEYDSLISNESSTFEPVFEKTTPIRTPFNLQAEFDASSSSTTLSWVNYNDIFQILPESGPNAYQTLIYETNVPMTRENSQDLTVQNPPIAQLASGISSYELTIPQNTDRQVFYSVSYLLPNFVTQGENYIDIRFLSNNALTESVKEDNTPPQRVNGVNAVFNPTPNSGGGVTQISWTDIFTEQDETYAIYTSGELFNNTEIYSSTKISEVAESVSEFFYSVPVGRLGMSYYCVVVIDQNGIYNTTISPNSCTSVYEDAFFNWTAEPTNVNAVFTGNGETKVTWVDQLGAEGERYHIWRSNYRVSGSQFVENVTMEYLGTVNDGVQEYIVQVPSEVDRTSFYFVTSEALYQHVSGTYHYTELIQNWFGPVYEDTVTPSAPRLNQINVLGAAQQINIEWLNDQQLIAEKYSIWRHFGSPFGEDEDEVSVVSEQNNWELFDDEILDTGSSNTQFSFDRAYSIPQDIDRQVWYAVIVEDEFGNLNDEAFPGSGGNSIQIREDTQNPTASYTLYDDEDEIYNSSSLVSGSYSIQVELNEYLHTSPTIDISTEGSQITIGAPQMLMYADNLLNPDLGPVYYYNFDISPSVIAGVLSITVELVDESFNSNVITWNDRALDAQNPILTVYSPGSFGDGSKYLYGNEITINAGVTDDVEVSEIYYKFVYNYGTSQSSTTPWMTPSVIEDVNGDQKALVFVEKVNAGNFDPGSHAVTIKTVDSAGNEDLKTVVFVVDFCRNRLDGTTVCNYEEDLKPALEPIIVEPSFSDPPYIFVWVTSGITVFAILMMLVIISIGIGGSKKKKSEDDYADEDDWMSEFIGTTQDVDMDSITNTTKSLNPEEDKEIPEIEEEEEDPFAVNVVQRKERRTKSKPQPEPEEEAEDPFFGLDDEDFEQDEEVPKPRRKVGRRAAPKNAPKRKVTRRKKTED